MKTSIFPCLTLCWLHLTIAAELQRIEYEQLYQLSEQEFTDIPSEWIQTMEDAFGPNGLGIIEVTNMPDEMIALRTTVLRYSQQLASLPKTELDTLTRPDVWYSIGWSHGREQLKDGSYDLSKGSFYFNPFDNDANVYPSQSLPEMEASLLEMTTFMGRVGLWIARLCDLFLMASTDHLDSCQEDSSVNTCMATNLTKSLETCHNCKARLLHYFPRKAEDIDSHGDDHQSIDNWCGWHTDHGSLTALLPGLLLDSDGSMVEAKNSTAGLYIQTRAGDIVPVQLEPTSLGFQIGETFQIQSRGRLVATPHAVRSSSPHLSRESLALFLQPSPEEVLPPLVETHAADDDAMSLSARWRSSFGEFQQATIRAFS